MEMKTTTASELPLGRVGRVALAMAPPPPPPPPQSIIGRPLHLLWPGYEFWPQLGEPNREPAMFQRSLSRHSRARDKDASL